MTVYLKLLIIFEFLYNLDKILLDKCLLMSSLEHRMNLLRSALSYLDKHKELENVKKEAAENKVRRSRFSS